MRVGKGYGRGCNLPKTRPTQNVGRDIVARLDPTRTAGLRLSYGRALVARLNRLKGDVVRLVHDQDILGKRPMIANPFTQNEKHTYASTQVDIEDPEVLDVLSRLQESLPAEDVIKYESTPHVTVRYGLHQLEGTQLQVAGIVGGSGKIVLTLGKLSVFHIEKEGVKQDVLKVEVHSPDLKELNARLGLLPNTQTYEYNPHMTIAYMKEGTAEQFLGDYKDLTGKVLTFEKVWYSNKDGDKSTIHLFSTSNISWMSKSFEEQLELFKDWLNARVMDHLIGSDEATEWKKYGLLAYQRGVLRAYDEVSKKSKGLSVGDRDKTGVYQGGKLQFMQDTTRRAFSDGSLGLLSARAFGDILAVTNAMCVQMIRTFTDGMISNKDTKDIAGQLIRDIDKIGATRLRLVAFVDVVRTYNEAKLDAYTALGVKEVGVDVEWSSGTQRTCRVCSTLSNATFLIPDARGHLPVHVGCYCTWKMVGNPTGQVERMSSSATATITGQPLGMNHECGQCVDLFSRALEASGIPPGTV